VKGRKKIPKTNSRHKTVGHGTSVKGRSTIPTKPVTGGGRSGECTKFSTDRERAWGKAFLKTVENGRVSLSRAHVAGDQQDRSKRKELAGGGQPNEGKAKH